MPATPRRIVVLAFPRAQTLDVAGPFEVFATADRWLTAAGRAPGGAYTLEVVAPDPGTFATSSGLRLGAHRGVRAAEGPLDTLMVAGGEGVWDGAHRATLVRWVRRTAPRARRLASVCTGAFLLAEAGLLDGRRATTHWAMCRQLAEQFPRVSVERDPIFVRDGNVYTSAGVTAGMDLALALVEEDFGREVALGVARWLVLFVKRPGGQSQFSAQLAAQLAEREPVRELQAWIVDHVGEDLSVGALARRVAMSPRNFARVFVGEVGVTPARYVEATRVEARAASSRPRRAGSRRWRTDAGSARPNPCGGPSCGAST